MVKSFAWIAAGLLACGLSAAAVGENAPLYGSQGISVQAVRQGTLGSCYFHASIAALAQSSPATLRAAIRSNPGGGYRVHFLDGPDEVVFPEDVSFGREHNFDRSDGTWVAVLMRGYAQRELRKSLVHAIQKSDAIPIYVKPIGLSLLEQSDLLLVGYDRAVRAVVQQDEAQMLTGFLDERGFFDALAATVQENGEVFGAYKSLGQGGVPGHVFEAFLGQSFSGLVADRKLTVEQLRQLRSGRMAVVAGSWSSANGADYGNADWWVAAHAYTVLSYDDAAGTVTLRNPWGTKPDPDGVFTLPLTVFLNAYQTYTYIQTP